MADMTACMEDDDDAPRPFTLLLNIVRIGSQYLDQDLSELKSKYSAHKIEFDAMLANCWKAKSFAQVRNLGEPPHRVARGAISHVFFLSAILQATPRAQIADYGVAQANISREEQCTLLVYGNMAATFII